MNMSINPALEAELAYRREQLARGISTGRPRSRWLPRRRHGR